MKLEHWNNTYLYANLVSKELKEETKAEIDVRPYGDNVSGRGFQFVIKDIFDNVFSVYSTGLFHSMPDLRIKITSLKKQILSTI